MNCQQAQKLIPAVHDAELDAANTLQLEEHISDCPTCFRSLRAISYLSADLRNPALRFAPPA
jgi:anti-sigma factor RsiW